MEGRPSRKVALTPIMIKEQLSFSRIPVVGATGKIVNFAPNTEQKRYVIFDSHRDVPAGFGVAVIEPTADACPSVSGPIRAIHRYRARGLRAKTRETDDPSLDGY